MEFNATFITFEDAAKEYGIQVKIITTDYYYKVQEWFIPWSEFGGGLSGEPEMFTKFAFSPGFNDRDEGEHFPPGVSSSGGSVKGSDALRWINKSSPWGSSKPPYNWGEIVLGQMLK